VAGHHHGEGFSSSDIVSRQVRPSSSSSQHHGLLSALRQVVAVGSRLRSGSTISHSCREFKWREFKCPKKEDIFLSSEKEENSYKVYSEKKKKQTREEV